MAKPPATIRDVARHAGLSVASISRVLNGHNHVHPDTRKKVIEAMDALGYIPNAAARSLSTAKSHAIGVVPPHLNGEFLGSTEERSEGKKCVSQCRLWWSRYP